MIDLNVTAIAIHVFTSLATTPKSLLPLHTPNFFISSPPSIVRPAIPHVNRLAYVNTTIENAKPLLYPTFPLIPPLTNDGTCYTPSTMKTIHTTSRNYLSAETSSLMFEYYSHNPRFLPRPPPPPKKTFASKIKSMVREGKQNVEQMVNKAMEQVQVAKRNIKQNASCAIEVLDSNPRVFPFITFCESDLSLPHSELTDLSL